jgi:hypothetical protein
MSPWVVVVDCADRWRLLRRHIRNWFLHAAVTRSVMRKILAIAVHQSPDFAD